MYDTNGLVPDVWWPPREVWEIRGADITFSPVYPAAMGAVDPDRGFSLRFPRFIRRKDDRSPETASAPDVLVQMYYNQTNPGAQDAAQDEVGDEVKE